MVRFIAAVFLVLMLGYCANLKCHSMNLNRIVADKSHRVIVASFLERLIICNNYNLIIVT